jgi:hypothetical protein
LLAATDEDPLDTICLFSSVAATFGNVGQSAYAMANEVLNHVASAEQARRPDRLVRAVGWGPWRGGMVTTALAEHFTRSGVPLIPVDRGAAAFTAELGSPDGETRIVVAAGDGLDPMTAPADPCPALVRLSARTHPYLADHDIAGVAVLPVTMALEWFARAAAGWRASADGVTVLRDVRVLDKLVLPRLAAPGHRLTVHGRPRADAAWDLELRGDEEALHYRAVLESRADSREAHTRAAPPGLTAPDPADLYDGRTLFHGPRFRAVRSLDGIGAQGAEGVVVGLRELGWIGDHWCLDPAALDGALQLTLLWARHVLGDACLPMAIARCRVGRGGPIAEDVRCVVRSGAVRESTALCDVALIDPDGTERIELSGVELVRRPA